jgi:drug/metabolite transporter (DMT)-like permease
MLWAVFTVIAASAQTARNAMQRDLVATLGTIGATQVRFLFGWPFAVLLLGLALGFTGEAIPGLTVRAFLWTLVGAGFQIAATALMLKSMASRSFVVTTAYTKTEPVQVALFGLIFLGDRLSPALIVAILIATAGVMILAWPRAGATAEARAWQPAALGLVAGGFFALSAIGFRGAIHALDSGSPWVRASTILAAGLILQTLVLLAYMLANDRATLRATLAAWRRSLFAGFTGAFASQFWFLGFALATAAQVRTLALIEVLMAYAVSGRLFNERLSRRDIAGMALVVAGVGIALNA